jgi:TolB protein
MEWFVMGRIILKLSSRLVVVCVIWTIIGVVGGRFIREGSHLAYASQDGANTSVMLFDVDRKLLFRLGSLGSIRLASDGVNRSLNWSPDGERIAFVSDTSALKTLNVLTMDGTLLAPVTSQSLGITVDWSPDSQHLIYTAYNVDTLWDSFSIALETVEEALPGIVVRSDASDYGAAWSPNGTHLAYVSDVRSINTGNLFVIPAGNKEKGVQVDFKTARQITQPPLTVFSPVSWSPDGTQMVFSAYVEHYERQALDLYHLDLRHTPPTMKQITRLARDNFSPAWSPDGKSLTYISTRDGYQAIYMQSLGETREIKRITGKHFIAVSSPMWSYDGRWLTFSAADRMGNTDIYVVEAGSEQVYQITHNLADDWSPSWRP